MCDVTPKIIFNPFFPFILSVSRYCSISITLTVSRARVETGSGSGEIFECARRSFVDVVVVVSPATSLTLVGREAV